jgi:CRISPR/Cas system-associated exonuclease Cas4 (RecB family)
MNTLEISYIGAACGKNKYEPRCKIMMLLLCREYPKLFREKLIQNGNIRPLEGISLKRPIEESYNKFSKNVKDPKEFDDIELKVINSLKSNVPDIDETDISKARTVVRDNLKKVCGKNNEESVIHISKYTKGNNKMWHYTDANHNWKLKGLHDATDKDMVIEIKTRMKKENIRKNEYDLYQLFGYMLVMGETRGMITQTHDGIVYKSTVENDNEYGIIDINLEKWNEKYIKFYKELNEFFKEVSKYTSCEFDISVVMKPGRIYAEYDSNGKFHNVDPKYTNIFKAL